jgi:hypothetical protein
LPSLNAQMPHATVDVEADGINYGPYTASNVGVTRVPDPTLVCTTYSSCIISSAVVSCSLKWTLPSGRWIWRLRRANNFHEDFDVESEYYGIVVTSNSEPCNIFLLCFYKIYVMDLLYY